MVPVITPRRVTLAGGIELACLTCGDVASPRVLMLHGFPQAAFVWERVMTALAPRARCVAPNLRGFAPSSAPPAVAAYRAKPLVADLCGLIDWMGGHVELLVAHDWGGALAWSLAAQAPQRIGHLLIVNAPHPGPLWRDLLGDAAQREASAYMNFLCRPDAELRLAEDDFARLWRFFEGPPAAAGQAPVWLDATTRARYRAVWRAGLTGPLNYYRATPLRPALSAQDALHRVQLDDDAITVRVPTTVLWGERDRALRPPLLHGLGQWVPDLRIERVADASHWLIDEQPDRVVRTIGSCLAWP